jgi:DNA-directed RNA polymerase subunit RPC12/RpoP
MAPDVHRDGRDDGDGTPGRTDRPLRCFSCDNRYDYLGRGAHPGRCPACGSRVVTPAEPVALSTVESVRPAGERPVVHATGEDATGRSLRVYLHAEPGSDGLVPSMVGIDEYVVDADDAWVDGLVPPTVVRALSADGFTLGGDPPAVPAGAATR